MQTHDVFGAACQQARLGQGRRQALLLLLLLLLLLVGHPLQLQTQPCGYTQPPSTSKLQQPTNHPHTVHQSLGR